jgi:hypothetical protein
MSKRKTTGGRAADKPKPQETASAETPIAAAPETIPEVPGSITIAARAVHRKWGTPLWVFYLASWTGSRYGTKPLAGRNNLAGIKATGTEPATEDGMAWFTNVTRCFDRLAFIVARECKTSDPAELVEALKVRCPDIDTSDYKLFMEA